MAADARALAHHPGERALLCRGFRHLPNIQSDQSRPLADLLRWRKTDGDVLHQCHRAERRLPALRPMVRQWGNELLLLRLLSRGLSVEIDGGAAGDWISTRHCDGERDADLLSLQPGFDVWIGPPSHHETSMGYRRGRHRRALALVHRESRCRRTASVRFSNRLRLLAESSRRRLHDHRVPLLHSNLGRSSSARHRPPHHGITHRVGLRACSSRLGTRQRGHPLDGDVRARLGIDGCDKFLGYAAWLPARWSGAHHRRAEGSANSIQADRVGGRPMARLRRTRLHVFPALLQSIRGARQRSLAHTQRERARPVPGSVRCLPRHLDVWSGGRRNRAS